MSAIPATMALLRQRYDVLLLDAYGVLVHGDGPIPGADALIQRLNREGPPYFVVTNDASRLPATAAKRYAAMGIDVPPERVITSGSLLRPYFASHRLVGCRCLVLGPEDSKRYVQAAGGELVGSDSDFDVLVIGDESGIEPFLDTLNDVLSTLLRRLDAGAPVSLLLPNPDLLFPRGERNVGITSGAIAALIEAVLAERYPNRADTTFRRLGKPAPTLFEEACRRAGTGNVVMIGDQLATDIRGANAAGIDSALYTGGLSGPTLPEGGPRPTYLLSDLA